MALSGNGRTDNAGDANVNAASDSTLRQFADHLVSRLGHDGARQACIDNQWVGILCHLGGERKKTARPN